MTTINETKSPNAVRLPRTGSAVRRCKNTLREITIEPFYDDMEISQRCETIRADRRLEAVCSKIYGATMGLRAAMMRGTEGRGLQLIVQELRALACLAQEGEAALKALTGLERGA